MGEAKRRRLAADDRRDDVVLRRWTAKEWKRLSRVRIDRIQAAAEAGASLDEAEFGLLSPSEQAEEDADAEFDARLKARMRR